MEPDATPYTPQHKRGQIELQIALNQASFGPWFGVSMTGIGLHELWSSRFWDRGVLG